MDKETKQFIRQIISRWGNGEVRRVHEMYTLKCIKMNRLEQDNKKLKAETKQLRRELHGKQRTVEADK